MRFLLIPLMILVVLAGGCITTNRRHNALHRRVARQNLKELHRNFDEYLMK